MGWWNIAKEIIHFASEVINEIDRDMDHDGDVDAEDVDMLIYMCQMYASLIGLVAQVDDEFSEEEMEVGMDVLHEISRNAIPDQLLRSVGYKWKEVDDLLVKTLLEPFSMKKVAKFASENDLEDDFYELACLMTVADGVIRDSEIEFLNTFAEYLNLNSVDRKRIERKYFK